MPSSEKSSPASALLSGTPLNERPGRRLHLLIDDHITPHRPHREGLARRAVSIAGRARRSRAETPAAFPLLDLPTVRNIFTETGEGQPRPRPAAEDAAAAAGLARRRRNAARVRLAKRFCLPILRRLPLERYRRANNPATVSDPLRDKLGQVRAAIEPRKGELGPSAPIRLFCHMVNITMIAVLGPIAAALELYALMRGENPRITAAAIVGTGLALQVEMATAMPVIDLLLP